jgi:Fe-Mn family superoxide dismutase
MRVKKAMSCSLEHTEGSEVVKLPLNRGSEISRRSFLGHAALIATGVAGTVHKGEAAAIPSARETGLSSEGLLVGLPGFQPRTAAPLPHDELPGFLSRDQLRAHHAEYVKAVGALKAAEEALESADRSREGAAVYAELRRRQVAAANDTLLHEFYFRNLATERVDFPRYLSRHMREHMGSLESWKRDFVACALVAKEWAVLVYDPYDDRWHDAVMDSDRDGVWIGANPLVVCDVSQHAYDHDYERKEDYVARFLERIDWNEVAGRYKKVDRM